MDQLEGRIHLGLFPTPLQSLARIGQLYGHSSLWIKRDDLTDIALGGNKIRKLEFLLEAALAEGADTILAFGGPQTNHGRLTAAAAARLGLKSILILDGDEPEELSGNLVLDNLLGAELYFCGDTPQEEFTSKIISSYENDGRQLFVIPMGGSNALGTLGYVLMMQELAEQMTQESISSGHLFVAAGSAGTLAGMVLGAKLFGLDELKIHGVPVFPPAEMDIAALTVELAQAAAKLLLREDLRITDEDFQVDLGPEEEPFYGIGYNIPDAKTFEAVRIFAAREGVILDPCYTGKAARAFLHFLNREVRDEESVIFVHTGGSPGLWSKGQLDFLNQYPEDELTAF